MFLRNSDVFLPAYVSIQRRVTQRCDNLKLNYVNLFRIVTATRGLFAPHSPLISFQGLFLLLSAFLVSLLLEIRRRETDWKRLTPTSSPPPFPTVHWSRYCFIKFSYSILTCHYPWRLSYKQRNGARKRGSW